MRSIALDIGGKRTGIALTDELGLIASGLKTVETINLISELKTLYVTHAWKNLAYGLPVGLDGKRTDGTAIVERQLQKIKSAFPQIPCIPIDERFTSKMARQAILTSKVNKKKRRDKALVDEVSATLILQTYMELQ